MRLTRRWNLLFAVFALVLDATGTLLAANAVRVGYPQPSGALSRYLVTNDSAILDEAYQTFRGIFPRVPYVTEDYIKSVIAVTDNPKAASADPKDFFDNHFIKEIEDSGFIKELYGQG